MNEKLQYASMLEIPVSTCNVTFKPKKKRLFKQKNKSNPEEVKNELLEKVNSGVLEETNAEVQEESETNASVQTVTVTTGKKKREKGALKKAPSLIAIAVIGVLLAVIFLTNAFYPSGINAFMNSVFGTGEQVASTDERTFESFAPCITFTGGAYQIDENGNVNFSGKGSVYAGCDGEVVSISQDEYGKYIVEIAHSDNFTSVIKGLDYAYATMGDAVYGNIPVGYVSETVSMCFVGENGSVITDYQIVDNTVVWGV